MLSQYSQVYLVWCSFNHEIGCNNLVHSPIFLNVLHFTMNIYLYTIFSNTFLFNNGAVSLNCGGCKGLYGHGRCPSTMVGSGWVLVGKGEKKKKNNLLKNVVYLVWRTTRLFFSRSSTFYVMFGELAWCKQRPLNYLMAHPSIVSPNVVRQ